MRLLTRLAASLPLILLVSWSAAAQDQQIPRFSDDLKPLVSAASHVSPKPGIDIVVLNDSESYVFETDGHSLHTNYVLYKILTQKGAEEWNDISVSWEPWHQEKPSVRARVIASDQSVHALDPATITDSPAKDNEDNVYGDRRVLRAPLPAIAPGVVIEEEDSVHESPEISGVGIVRRAYFGRRVPVQSTHFEIEAPSSLPLHYTRQLLPDLKVTRDENGDRVHTSFDYGPMDTLDEPDEHLPPEVPAYPKVVFSTGTSWSQMADAYGKIVDDRIAGSDVRTLVGKLTSSKRSRDEKIQAIWQYLSTDIRYTGVEFAEAAVVPRSPSEVLTHKYGDCKDKSVLLVALLRAAGIPAYVALLDATDREDIQTDLPGMGLFDHAIVFVPGSPDLWIDATDQYARLGELPIADQNRYALIVQPDVKTLSRTPSLSAEDNILVEDREFQLSEYGPAHVVETSHPHGSLETYYRADYTDIQSKDVKEGLGKYVKDLYLSDKLDNIARSDPSDLSKPFELVLTCNRAKRGSTDLGVAVAAIRLEAIFDRLPDDLKTRQAAETGTSNSTDEKPKKKRTADYQLAEPFITEWHYKVIPPDGFQPKPLSKDSKVSLGPAVLDEQFSADKDGVVHATIRFEIAKDRLTPSEALEMRNRVADVKDTEPILIYFEPVADALLSQGRALGAFQSYRDLIAAHPKHAVYHLRKAEALLAGGLGEAARQEARLAVSLEPNSAMAQKTLADILEYDLVGRKFRPGSDYDGAAAAFRAAEKLDRDDKTLTGNLAILLEYNTWGLRYGPGAKLDEAVAEYRRLTPQELENMGLKNNVPFALFYDRKFAEAQKTAETLNPQPASLIVACEGAVSGAQAGIAEAKKRTGSEEQLRELIRSAGQLLANLRNYSIAADFYEAGASGEDASSWMSDAVTFRKTQPNEKLLFPDTPVGVALHFALLTMDADLTVEKMRTVASRNGAQTLATPENVEEYVTAEKRLISQKARAGTFSDIGVDTALTNAQPTTQGDDQTGYKVTLWPAATYKTAVYVVKEAANYRVLGRFPGVFAGLGSQILDDISNNNLNAARTLLDWLRDDWHLSGGDDPFEGAAFPRLWTKGSDPDPATIKLAAGALLATSRQTADAGIAILETAKGSVRNEDETKMASILLALLDGYIRLERYDKALQVCEELAKIHPESKRIFLYQSSYLRILRRLEDANALAQERLKRLPGDADAQRALVYNALTQGNHTLAHTLALKFVQSGNALPSDLNLAAWESLFANVTTPQDLENSISASKLSPNFPELHTLACVYAEVGKTKEARDILIQAMDKANYDDLEPNSWYTVGRIAEQFGELDIGVASYRRVEKPKRDFSIPDSSYELAQLHLRALGVQPQQADMKPATKSPHL